MSGLIYLRDEDEDEGAGGSWAGVLFIALVLVPVLSFVGLASAMALRSEAGLVVALLGGSLLASVLTDRLLRDAPTRDRQKGALTAAILAPLATLGLVLAYAAYAFSTCPNGCGFA